MIATSPTSISSLYHASKLLRTKLIQHASSYTWSPIVTKYAKHKALEQKLTGPLEESHKKGEIPLNSFGKELRARRSKSHKNEQGHELRGKGDFF